MTFIVVLVALLIERYFDWSHLRKWGWYGACERLVMEKTHNAAALVVLAGSILPLLALVILARFLLADTLYGFPWLIIQLFVVLYCFGPQNLWADAFAARNAFGKGDASAVSDSLKTGFHITETQNPEALHRELVSQIFIAANQRIFAVVFWFMALGLPGAVLYRLVNISAQNDAGSEINSAARTFEMGLDWIPVRLFTILFALGGNFTRVLSVWRKRAMLGPEGNDLLMSECGLAAITDDSEKISMDGSLEKSAMYLLDRVFIILLVLLFVPLLHRIFW